MTNFHVLFFFLDSVKSNSKTALRFFPIPIMLLSMPRYHSVEEAFADLTIRHPDRKKKDILRELLDEKFSQRAYENQLIATGDAILINRNYEHENYWGSCGCPNILCRFKNKNIVGKMLMEKRDELNGK